MFGLANLLYFLAKYAALLTELEVKLKSYLGNLSSHYKKGQRQHHDASTAAALVGETTF